jgi:hypothetical protein
LLAYSAHLSAEVYSFQVHSHPVRLEVLDQPISDLLANSLLDREASRKEAHQSRELGQSNDVLMSDVGDVGDPLERQSVMFAESDERNRPFDDLADLAVRASSALGGEYREKLGISLVADRRVEHSPDEASRCGARRHGIHVHSQAREDLCCRRFHVSPLLGSQVARPNLLPSGEIDQTTGVLRGLEVALSRAHCARLRGFLHADDLPELRATVTDDYGWSVGGQAMGLLRVDHPRLRISTWGAVITAIGLAVEAWGPSCPSFSMAMSIY